MSPPHSAPARGAVRGRVNGEYIAKARTLDRLGFLARFPTQCPPHSAPARAAAVRGRVNGEYIAKARTQEH